jgi:hypothetical protein
MKQAALAEFQSNDAGPAVRQTLHPEAKRKNSQKGVTSPHLSRFRKKSEGFR